MGVLTRPRGFALLIRDAAWRGARYRAMVPGPNINGDLAPDVTASAPLPAPGATGTCPFETGLYKQRLRVPGRAVWCQFGPAGAA